MPVSLLDSFRSVSLQAQALKVTSSSEALSKASYNLRQRIQPAYLDFFYDLAESVVGVSEVPREAAPYAGRWTPLTNRWLRTKAEVRADEYSAADEGGDDDLERGSDFFYRGITGVKPSSMYIHRTRKGSEGVLKRRRAKTYMGRTNGVSFGQFLSKDADPEHIFGPIQINHVFKKKDREFQVYPDRIDPNAFEKVIIRSTKGARPVGFINFSIETQVIVFPNLLRGQSRGRKSGLEIYVDATKEKEMIRRMAYKLDIAHEAQWVKMLPSSRFGSKRKSMRPFLLAMMTVFIEKTVKQAIQQFQREIKL